MLWLIAGALLAAILVVRTKGMLTQPAFVAEFSMDASSAFTLPLRPDPALDSLDVFAYGDQPGGPVKNGMNVTLPAHSIITLRGWAFDMPGNGPYRAVGARISGSSQVFSAVIDIARPDVAAALRNSAAENSGFSLSIDTAQVPLGRHTIDVRGVGHDGHTAARLVPAIDITIVNRMVATQNTDAIDAVNGVIVNSTASAAAPVAVMRSYGKLTVTGWGFVTDGQRPANAVTLLVDGNAAGTVIYGRPRPDVATRFHDIRLGRTGIEAVLPLAPLAPGPHEITFRLGLSDGTSVPAQAALHINLQ